MSLCWQRLVLRNRQAIRGTIVFFYLFFLQLLVFTKRWMIITWTDRHHQSSEIHCRCYEEHASIIWVSQSMDLWSTPTNQRPSVQRNQTQARNLPSKCLECGHLAQKVKCAFSPNLCLQVQCQGNATHLATFTHLRRSSCARGLRASEAPHVLGRCIWKKKKKLSQGQHVERWPRSMFPLKIWRGGRSFPLKVLRYSSWLDGMLVGAELSWKQAGRNGWTLH